MPCIAQQRAGSPLPLLAAVAAAAAATAAAAKAAAVAVMRRQGGSALNYTAVLSPRYADKQHL